MKQISAEATDFVELAGTANRAQPLMAASPRTEARKGGRIVLITRAKTPNVGNQALSIAWINMVKKAFPEADLTVLERKTQHLRRYSFKSIEAAADPYAELNRLATELARLAPAQISELPVSEKEIRLVSHENKTKSPLNKVKGILPYVGFYKGEYVKRLGLYNQSDLVIINPAGEFFPRNPLPAFYHLLEALVIQKLGVPVAMVNHTLEIKNPTLRVLIPKIYKQLAFIGFRDNKSLEEFVSMGGDVSNAVVTPDLTLTTTPPKRRGTVKNRIGVAIHTLEARARDQFSSWQELVQGLAGQGFQISLISNEMPSDLPFYEELKAKIPALQIEGGGLPYKEYCEFLTGFEFLVTSRMHTGILSMVSGTPVVPIEPTAFKMTGLFRELGFDQKVITTKEPGWVQEALEAAKAMSRNREEASRRCAGKIAELQAKIFETLVPKLQQLIKTEKRIVSSTVANNIKLEVEELGHSHYRARGLKGFIRTKLPAPVYHYLRGLRLRQRQTAFASFYKIALANWYEFLASNGVLAGLFYAIWSRGFDREHKGTLAARARYFRDIFAKEGNVYILRRNVHKLEKGLVMKPRRDVFGTAYLHETVISYRDCVARIKEGTLDDVDTIRWSKQVLDLYFEAVKSHPIVDKSKKIYYNVGEIPQPQQDTTKRVPYVRPENPDLPDYESLMRLALYRRSVRWFEQRPVPREIIDKAVLLAGLSPSACNRQPFRFAVFDDPKLCQEVGSIPKGTPGWLHNIPCFIVIVGTLEAFDREKDRHVPYIDGSLAAMSLCYALEVQGVSSCCVNWQDLAETESRMAAKLGLKRYERPIMCLAIGFPDKTATVPFSQKLPLDELRQYNKVASNSKEGSK